jgi:multisubunit Na+/H+ antiporter MnhC subunit
MNDFMPFCAIAIVLLLVIGFYCVIVTNNMIRALIGVEILIKAVTLLIIMAGYQTGQTGLAQSMAITVIVVEVAVTAVAAGIVLAGYRFTNSIHASELRKLKE